MLFANYEILRQIVEYGRTVRSVVYFIWQQNIKLETYPYSTPHRFKVHNEWRYTTTAAKKSAQKYNGLFLKDTSSSNMNLC